MEVRTIGQCSLMCEDVKHATVIDLAILGDSAPYFGGIAGLKMRIKVKHGHKAPSLATSTDRW
jgi:hypothetical protein